MWLDYDHDYDLDLVLLGPEPALMRNQGAAGWVDRTGDFPFVKGNVARRAEDCALFPTARLSIWPCSTAIARRCLYRDQLGGQYTSGELSTENQTNTCKWMPTSTPPAGLTRARIDADGSVHFGRNQSSLRNWIRVQLKGVRSLKLAQDALVEIKAGTLYRRQFYERRAADIRSRETRPPSTSFASRGPTG